MAPVAAKAENATLTQNSRATITTDGKSIWRGESNGLKIADTGSATGP
jgi:hypothetical protein